MKTFVWPTLTLIAAVSIATGCVKPTGIVDPHAVGPKLDRWQATVPGTPSQTFDVAMRVLTDSSYKIMDAKKDAGVIQTDYRNAADVEKGALAMRLKLIGGFPVRLSLVLTPAGSDSTRVDVTGIFGTNGRALTRDETGWQYVRNIGLAIVAETAR